MKRITKAIAAMMLAVIVVFATGCGSGNGNNNSGSSVNDDHSMDMKSAPLSGTCGGHDYIDLGLPSGTLWATCNVGANAPEEYGDYFAWGETKPKTIYSWNTYEYCHGDKGWNELTGYCNVSDRGFNGFTDTLTALQPNDDAAMANWGSGWYTPTMEQWEELKKNATQDWTVQKGVAGLRFTSSNGNSLFLPAAGGRWGDEGSDAGRWGKKIHDDGCWGYCWSSTLRTDFAYDAWGFFCNSDTCGISYNSRYYGLSVRPVRSPSQN